MGSKSAATSGQGTFLSDRHIPDARGATGHDIDTSVYEPSTLRRTIPAPKPAGYIDSSEVLEGMRDELAQVHSREHLLDRLDAYRTGEDLPPNQKARVEDYIGRKTANEARFYLVRNLQKIRGDAESDWANLGEPLGRVALLGAVTLGAAGDPAELTIDNFEQVRFPGYQKPEIYRSPD